MCVVSALHEHYEPVIPYIEPYLPPPTETVPTPKEWIWRGQVELAKPQLDLSKLADLLREFRELVEAAKRIDRVTGQPDCLDPEKAKLTERVAELEKLIAAPPEFVISSGGVLEPGRYRVIDGKLYRAVE